MAKQTRCRRNVAEPARKRRGGRAALNRDLDRVESASGFGIFSGSAHEIAVLRFNRYRARWVSEESWHPQQRGRWLPDGGYELSLPYAREAELVMDILKYGPDCEVLKPPPLRAAVAERLRLTLSLYEAPKGDPKERPGAD